MRTVSVLVGTSVLLGSLLVATTAGAAPVLCRRKVQLKVREDTCRKKETQLTVDDLAGLDAGTVASQADSIKRFGFVKLGDGETMDLLEVGPLKLTARCRLNVAGQDIADVLISTTQAGAVFDGSGSSTNLTPATPEDQRVFADASAATGNPAIDQETDGAAMAVDGTGFTSQPIVGVNVLESPGKCVFGGYAVVH
jgi:hypothetical protein